MALVIPLWKSLKEEQAEIKLKVLTLIRDKEREIAAVRRKVEWEMNGTDKYFNTMHTLKTSLLNHFLFFFIFVHLGKTETLLNDALAEVKKHAQNVFPVLEKSVRRERRKYL